MGVKRDYDGLKVEPAFPAEWESAKMTRHFRNADYHITICNPDHVEGGIPIITVDGNLIDGNIIPDFRDGKRHEVAVLLK